jgi:hypothetical protein
VGSVPPAFATIVYRAFLHSVDSRWRNAPFVAKTCRRYNATRNSSENSRMLTRSLAATKTATNSFDSHMWLHTKLFVPECVSLVRIPSTVANGRGAERNAASMKTPSVRTDECLAWFKKCEVYGQIMAIGSATWSTGSVPSMVWSTLMCSWFGPTMRERAHQIRWISWPLWLLSLAQPRTFCGPRVDGLACTHRLRPVPVFTILSPSFRLYSSFSSLFSRDIERMLLLCRLKLP